MGENISVNLLLFIRVLRLLTCCGLVFLRLALFLSIWFHGTSASRGVSILLNKSLNFAILDKWEDKDGRLLLINIQIDDTIFTLVCIYAPNCKTARNAFLFL
jgi:exonuclease III